MIKINDFLYIGKCNECTNDIYDKFGIILACNSPCITKSNHTSSQKKNDLQRLFHNSCEHDAAIKEKYFFNLNIINCEIPRYNINEFKAAITVIEKWKNHRDILIISENAESRAPSIALLWLAFKEKSISNSSYQAARLDFTRMYSKYIPWPGIVIFLSQEWESFRHM